MTNTATEAVRIGTAGLSSESVDLSDFAERVGGSWPAGWYSATIIPGFASSKGRQILTEDSLSKNGDSHNLRVCFTLTHPDLGTTTKFESFNYRVTDFTPDKLAQIKDLREQFKGVRGAWPGQSDAQRTSLAIASLGQFTKA